jgi:hypothetical protein
MKVASGQPSSDSEHERPYLPGGTYERIADAWQIGGGTSEHILSGMTDQQRGAFTRDPVFGPVIETLRSREAGRNLEAGE